MPRLVGEHSMLPLDDIGTTIARQLIVILSIAEGTKNDYYFKGEIK